MRAPLLFRSTLAEWRAYNMGVSTIPASGGGGLTPRYAKFTTSGTFNLPDGYGAAKPLVVTIQVIGGGGAGSGSLGAGTWSLPTSVRVIRNDYFGNVHAFFPVNIGTQPSGNITRDFSANQDGWGGGSGGIAQTQMALTAPLTITVGAAGARSTTQNSLSPRFAFSQWGRGGSSNTGARNFNVDYYDNMAGSSTLTAGGTGGMSTAGSVSATGGAGGGGGNFGLTVNSGTVFFPSDVNIDSGNSVGPFNALPNISGFNSASGSNGAAGQPAGSAGSATPLLGAIAGGSGTTTPVYGAFGVGGKRGDSTTHTGVEGTGGGYGSIGASGAVIISYWA